MSTNTSNIYQRYSEWYEMYKPDPRAMTATPNKRSAEQYEQELKKYIEVLNQNRRHIETLQKDVYELSNSLDQCVRIDRIYLDIIKYVKYAKLQYKPVKNHSIVSDFFGFLVMNSVHTKVPDSDDVLCD